MLHARWLGTVPYRDGLRMQERLVEERRRGETRDLLLLLEHPAVITLGRRGDPEHVLLDEARRNALGIEMYETGRGGDVTYHGPGQLVGYPILALPEPRRDVHRFLRDIEEALIRTAADFGVGAGRVAGLTGIWADDRKLAAIGVRLSTGWITSHGFAFNVSTDLSGFDAVVPCGIRDRGVTSLLDLTGEVFPLEEVAAAAARHLAGALGMVAVEWGSGLSFPSGVGGDAG